MRRPPSKSVLIPQRPQAQPCPAPSQILPALSFPAQLLTATNSNGVLAGSATTDSHGQYRMEDLAPGSYRIKAQATGFETQSFATEVAPSVQAVADATLRVGSAAQTVNVQASPAPNTPSADANQALKPAAGRPLSRFELTTDDGERWTSIDGQNWARR